MSHQSSPCPHSSSFPLRDMLHQSSNFDLGDHESFMPTLNSTVPFHSVAHHPTPLHQPSIPADHSSSPLTCSRIDPTLFTDALCQQNPLLLPPSYSQLFTHPPNQTCEDTHHINTSSHSNHHPLYHDDDIHVQPPPVSSAHCSSSMHIINTTLEHSFHTPVPVKTCYPGFEVNNTPDNPSFLSPSAMQLTDDEKADTVINQEEKTFLSHCEIENKANTRKRKGAVSHHHNPNISFISGAGNTSNLPTDYSLPNPHLQSPPTKRQKGSARPSVNKREVDVHKLREDLYHSLSQIDTQSLSSAIISDAAALALHDTTPDLSKPTPTLNITSSSSSSSAMPLSMLTAAASRNIVNKLDENVVEDDFVKLVSCAEDICEQIKVDLRGKLRAKIDNCTPQEASKIEAKLSRVNKNLYALSLEEILKVALREILVLKHHTLADHSNDLIDKPSPDTNRGHEYHIPQ